MNQPPSLVDGPEQPRTPKTNPNRTDDMHRTVENLKAAGAVVVDVRGVDAFDKKTGQPHAWVPKIFHEYAYEPNWKAPIEAEVPLSVIPRLAAAIAFYTSSETLLVSVGNGKVKILAPGYYETVGA